MDAPPSDYSLWNWSSADAPTAARLFAWRDLVARKLLKLNVDPVSDTPFQVDVYLRALPGLRFAWGMVDASRNSRTREISSSDNDDFVVMMNFEDRLVIEQRGQELILGAGEACLTACSEPASYNRPSAGKLLCLRLPRESLSPLVPNIYDRTMKLIPSDTAALRLLTSYIRILDDNHSTATPELRELIVGHIHGLSSLVLNPDEENIEAVEDNGLKAARLKAVKTSVLKNIHRPDLSIGLVAVQNRVSPRYVQKLFETEGATFSEFVITERLERVHAALQNPNSRRQSISDIAFRHGFGDISHFNHLFRRRFGASPKDVRNRDVLAIEPAAMRR